MVFLGCYDLITFLHLCPSIVCIQSYYDKVVGLSHDYNASYSMMGHLRCSDEITKRITLYRIEELVVIIQSILSKRHSSFYIWEINVESFTQQQRTIFIDCCLQCYFAINNPCDLTPNHLSCRSSLPDSRAVVVTDPKGRGFESHRSHQLKSHGRYTVLY